MQFIKSILINYFVLFSFLISFYRKLNLKKSSCLSRFIDFINVGAKVKTGYSHKILFKSRVEGRWNVSYMLYSTLVFSHLFTHVITIITL